MKTYEVEFNEQQDKGIYAVSLVEDPAMEGMFIALNKQEQIKLAKVDEEQRILLGVALVPDKPILRLTDEGEEFQIIFRKDTISNTDGTALTHVHWVTTEIVLVILVQHIYLLQLAIICMLQRHPFTGRMHRLRRTSC